MNRVWSAGMALAVFSGCLGAPQRLPTDWSAARESFLRPKIREQDGKPVIAVGGEAVPASPWLSSFYARRSDHLAWNGASGPLPQVYELVQALRQAEGDGLPAAAYRLPAIEAAMGPWRRGAMAPTRRALVGLAELDLRCTNAFLLYADHLQGGRVSPQARDWPGGAPGEDPGQLLERALGNNRVGQALEELRPSHPEYARLEGALAEYRRIADQGGWAALPAGAGLKKGQRHPAVAALRRQLAMVGDLDTAAAGNEGFDEELERAVRRFQRRHSLPASGRVDASTLEALAIPVEERIAQIELNMERWRWLPRGGHYILVRLDEFALDLVEEGQVSLSMRIVAGKDQWRTPIFSSPMTYVVFNPYWNVPPSIAVEEVLPALRQDPAYLEQKGLQVVRGQGDEARIIAADTLDWEAISPDSLPYTFIQLPGPENPLGRMKFVLPNEFNIYLHDTPNRELFARQERGFSHGCIRLEKSLELAVRLLGVDPAWPRDRIQELIQSGKTRHLDLPRPIPVYFSYWTVWADEEGQVAFRPDLYGGDQRLREALANEL